MQVLMNLMKICANSGLERVDQKLKFIKKEKVTCLEFENEQLKKMISDLEKNTTKAISELQIQNVKHY